MHIHTFRKIHTHAHTCTQTALRAGWHALWADTGPLMACWAHPLCLVKSVRCVCMCVFVVKSTLATVCLSISPVWQHWKELLFRGQPHPTLINKAARASRRDWEARKANRGGGRKKGETVGAPRAPALNQQHHMLFHVLTYSLFGYGLTSTFPRFPLSFETKQM